MYRPLPYPIPPLPYPTWPPLSTLESSYSLPHWRHWFSENWTISIIISVIYVILIFAIQLIMRKRERFELRGVLAVWNFALAGFSLAGTLRVWPEMGERFLFIFLEFFNKSLVIKVTSSSAPVGVVGGAVVVVGKYYHGNRIITMTTK